jgi:hypothetical protein
MLIYAVERFSVDRDTPDEHQSKFRQFVWLTDYRNQLINHGFLCRKQYAEYASGTKDTAFLSGLLGHDNALEDARSHPALAATLATFDKGLFRERTVEYFESVHTEDDSYCQHERWDSLTLMCDSILGISSLRCGICGGLVARYRLNMCDETASALWNWERQYDTIHGSWLMSAEYESLASRELCDIHSTLNTLGLSIVASLIRDIGCDVKYFLHTGAKPPRRCPRCGLSLQRIALPRPFLLCPKCQIVM